MTGVGAVVALLAWIVYRAVQGAHHGDGSTGPTRPQDLLALVWAGSVLALVGGVTLALGPVGLLVALPFAALLLEPSALAEALVPRGWTRAVWLLTRVSQVVWRRDRDGGAAMMAARADLAAGVVPEIVVTGPITAGFAVAEGLRASADGDLPGARAAIAAAGWFDVQAGTLAVVRAEYEVAEHAAAGRWDAIAAMAPDGSARLRLTTAVAERLLDLDDATDAARFEALSTRFAADPRWSPILDRARSARHRATFRGPDLPDDPLTRALEVHRRALLDPAWLEAALDAWDDLDVPVPIRERVIEDLADGFAAAGRQVDEGPGVTSSAVRDRLDGAVLAAAQAQGQALARRVGASVDLDPMAELREFAWFVAHVPPVDTEPDTAHRLRRRVLFRAMYGPLNDWASALYNRRGEPYLFRAVTRWLLAHAKAVDDSQAEASLLHNLGVSAPFA